jgi:hypothetical protein
MRIFDGEWINKERGGLMADATLEAVLAHVAACSVCTAANKRVNDFCTDGQVLFLEYASGHAPNRAELVEITPEQHDRLLAHARRRLRNAGRN